MNELYSPIEENSLWFSSESYLISDLRVPSQSKTIQSWFLFLGLVQLLDHGRP